MDEADQPDLGDSLATGNPYTVLENELLEAGCTLPDCAKLFAVFDGTTHGATGREECNMHLGGHPGANARGEFAKLIELFSGVHGPKEELRQILAYLKDLRAEQALLYPDKFKGYCTYLYDVPVWVVDNCSSNRGCHKGLLVMIDAVRRLEYLWLKASGLRPHMSPFIQTEIVSCQHHDSNLINVDISRITRRIDEASGPDGGRGMDPYQPGVQVEEVRGNKKTESLTCNFTRFLSGCFRKDPSWRAFMVSRYNDRGSIPVVKCARFWSVLQAAHYLYLREKFVWEFDSKHGPAMADLQIGKTLKYGKANEALNSFGLELSALELTKIHSPFNYSAANKAADEQAKVVRELVQEHEGLLKDIIAPTQGVLPATLSDTQAAHKARTAHFVVGVRPLRIERQLFEEDCRRQRGSDENKQPRRTKEERTARQAELCDPEQEPAFAAVLAEEPPAACDPRLGAVHLGVRNKLRKMLEQQAETGTVPEVVLDSGAPNTSFICEDVFQYTRMLHDRYAWISNGLMDAMRRVSKAPEPFKLTDLPLWWPQWLSMDAISTRARNIIANVWVDFAGRAKLRQDANTVKAAEKEVATAKTQAKAAKAKDKAVNLEGGMVGRGTDHRCLQPAELVSQVSLNTVDFAKPATANGWDVPTISNQLRLRNISEYRESNPEVMAAFDAVGLRMKDGFLKVTGKRDELIERLKGVVQAEKSVTDKARSDARKIAAKDARAEANRTKEAEKAAKAAAPAGAEGGGGEGTVEHRSKRTNAGNAPKRHRPADEDDRPQLATSAAPTKQGKAGGRRGSKGKGKGKGKTGKRKR